MDPAYLASLIAVILTRAAERVLLVLAGGLAIYLGYRLFAVIPAADRSEGRISLPGGVSIFLTRIGPGVFFALFGCAIIGYSATKPVEFRIPVELSAGRAVPAEARAGGYVQYSGLGPAPGAAGPSPQAGLEAPVIIARLNAYLDDMRQRLDRPAAAEFAAAVRAAKLAVMLGGWKSEWGDRDAFAKWVGGGAEGDPPTDRAAGAVIVFGTSLR